MRTSLQLLRSAFGDPKLPLECTERISDCDTGEFKCYRVRPPRDKYRGLLPTWDFAIIPQHSPKRSPSKETIKYAVRDSNKIAKSRKHHEVPLVMISDEPSIRLTDKLRFDRQNIFFLDHTDLVSSTKQVTLRSSPLLRAVRNKLSRTELSSILFTPYQPNKPAFGWRFFGRRNELERLVESNENFIVVGARRIGKTSLLQEARRRLKEKGQKVYYVDAQHCRGQEELVKEIIRTFSARDVAHAVRRSQALDESLLASVLRRAGGKNKRTTLIIDELGNVISKARGTDWHVVGMLRSQAQRGRIRIIMSAFQEFFLKQLQDYSGPFVNFATIVRLRGFSDSEVIECLLDPLGIWARTSDRPALLNMIVHRIGRHPHLLQHLGQALFEKVARGGNRDLNIAAASLLEKEELTCFMDPVHEMFYRMPSSTQRYLFLRRCHEAASEGKELRSIELDDDWVETVLQEEGYESTYDGRRFLLGDLEIRGLTRAAKVGSTSRQRIAAPIVYSFIRHAEGKNGVLKLIAKLGKEIKLEKDRLNLHAA